jgi:hypothetical protein
MKRVLVFLVAVLSVGCCASNKYNDEKMYDLASQFKDLAQTVDGTVKFGKKVIENGEQALAIVAIEYPDKVAPFTQYSIKVDLQGDNAVLLLCDAEIGLIEDAGCNSVLDKIYWKNVEHHNCAFTIDSNLLCR